MEPHGLRRTDLALTVSALAAMTVLAWIVLAHHSGATITGDPPSAMAQASAWSAENLALAFLMWTVMMVAMMVPAAGPMVVAFVAIADRTEQTTGKTVLRAGGLLAGYLLAWTGFSLAAASGQLTLQRLALLSSHTMAVTPLLGGVLLALAGMYQLTPLKFACLSRCQSPHAFLLAEWRDGGYGAFVIGLRHGAYCVGCCWFLMTLLFVAGVMSLLWSAAIAAFVLVERLIPGRLLSQASGALLLAAGTWQVIRSLHV